MFKIIFLIFLFIIVFYFILVITIGRKNSKNQIQEYQKRLKQQNVLSEDILNHLGGHPYLQTNDNIFFQIRNDNTIYFYKENTNTGKEIPISDLTRYEVKTETEISRDVTLTRLLTLGILAFGIKKKTKTEEQFLILSYMQNGVEVNCMFKRWCQSTQLGDIISTINKLKIEENREEECAIN